MPWKLLRAALSGWILALTLVGSIEAQMPSPGARSVPTAVTKARIPEAFGSLPLAFIENQGQLDGRVAYYVQGRDTTVYFTPAGVTLVLTGPAAPPPAKGSRAFVQPVGLRPPAPDSPRQRWAVKLDFVAANPGVNPTAQDPTPAVVSYFKGPREQWKTGVQTYATLVYPDLWPGIDLVYSGTVNRLKYTFVIKPGADPQQIKLAYRGATGVRLTEAGQLEVSTPVGGFRDERPAAYQDGEGGRVKVAAAYALEPAVPAAGQGYGFSLGPYDRARPLILDPAILVYAGYIGGAGFDQGSGIAVDSAGNAYVTGITGSSEATFPVTGGPDPTFNDGIFDAFVAKVNAAGTALIYAGYIGGAGGDQGSGIAVDSAGSAYVTGVTSSSEATFPVTVGPDLSHNGGFDAFVAKVNAAGTALVYAGYIGGADQEVGNGIAVDSAGNAYVTGSATSSEATFPVTGGPDPTFNGGSMDAFVAKVNAAGTALSYAGYIGGAGDDRGLDIAVDSAGNAYVAGFTDSSEATFPVTGGPDLTHNGGFDAFVAKVTAAGTALAYAGYIGGADQDVGLSIALDSARNAYITGSTGSSQATFPVTGGPDPTFNGGTMDAFVAKVNAAGTALSYAGYIGGAADDFGLSIAVDSAGNAYVTGFTTSAEATFPVTGGPDLTHNGGFDAFVAKVNAAGTALVYAGYIGGAGTDQGLGIAVDSAGSAYVTGLTISFEATFPVTGGPDLTFNGGTFDAFVAKITEVAPSGKVTGGGQITVAGRRSSFGFNAKQDGGTASGHVNYLNHATRAHLDCTVTAVADLTATRARFSGTCSPRSAAGSFTAEVEDNGEPGKNTDTFKITFGSITDGATVRSGNIQIHR